ncbi:MAG: cytochrome C [Rhodocyclaceae bacterium]|nr:cytochrome C [Rhodocyclaceae bacterium]MBX3668483.1 cytochrome C [Rhodocyclaceae bacterium]
MLYSRLCAALRQFAAIALICGLAGVASQALAVDAVPPATDGPGPKLDNASCLSCHDSHRRKLEMEGKDGEKRKLAGVDAPKFARGVHANLQCVACHTDITDAKAQHEKLPGTKVDCAGCHEALWANLEKSGQSASKPRLETVVKNIQAYRNSYHARPDKDEPSRAKANCEDCHASHYFNVPAANSPQHAAWRREVPAQCGEKCHEDQLEDYTGSVHGKLLADESKPDSSKAAVCTDCHTTHSIDNTSKPPVKLLITENCGGCHDKQFESYSHTYHGQVASLGYAYTAKCFDCHGSHGILKVDDPKSRVAPANRLKTCQKCHDGKKQPLATAGFVSFGPHAHAGDFNKYPQMWVASRFMLALLLGVFAFFWAHCLLWYHREWKDRKLGVTHQLIKTADLGLNEKKHFRRFALGWRIGHLLFALVTMTLVLTGTTALYAHSAWAPVVARALGGPAMVGVIHRVAAALFIGTFFVHFVVVMYNIFVRYRGHFRWFGPDSLIPRWQDFKDCWGMFRWFLGKGPRPALDRWAYFEKFDYWAVFWGVNVIGFSGLMLAFPHVTASVLPGWIFNVATLVHGEEAFLAAVFLFTVHFFNNHFRPDKLPPPDIVMFTGTQSIEEFRRDHPAQYDRLVASGELSKHLVDAPSAPMTMGSKLLGLFLIGCGLALLVLVAIGFFSGAAV